MSWRYCSYQGDEDPVTDPGGARSEEGAEHGGWHSEDDGGYRRGRHRWQYPDKYQDIKRRRGNGAPPNPQAGRPQSNPFGGGSGRIPNTFSTPQSGRVPNGPFLPGTGRFLPPLERKLQFPFKGNPQHRGFHWGPSPNQRELDTPEGKDSISSSSSVHTFQSPPSPNKGQWQRRNHGNRGRGNRNRSRNRGRNPFDGFIQNQHEINEECQDGAESHPRAKYTWYNPGPVQDGVQQTQQSKQGFQKHQNPYYYVPPRLQSSPPEKIQNWSGESSAPMNAAPPIRHDITSPMET